MGAGGAGLEWGWGGMGLEDGMLGLSKASCESVGHLVGGLLLSLEGA